MKKNLIKLAFAFSAATFSGFISNADEGLFVNFNSVLNTNIDGAQLLNDAHAILNSKPMGSMLNLQACMSNSGQIEVIYSSDFRYNLAYVYDSNLQDFNQPINYTMLNLTFVKVIENQNGVEIFQAHLGYIDLVCARNAMVLE